MSTLPTLISKPSVSDVPLYAPPSTSAPIDLHLDANEGPPRDVDISRILSSLGSDAVRRYPGAGELECLIAERWNIRPSQVLVTAGGDEAIDRACRAMLAAGRDMLLAVPTFEMLHRYAILAGADVVTVDWHQGPYPIEQVRARITSQTAMIAVVSPNNPTGAVVTAIDLARLATAAPNATLLVDCAYAEFADEDLTAAALQLPNAIVIRTFSKAFSMAGLRVGYALGSERNIRRLRGAGSPFPVSALSLAIAADAFVRSTTTVPPLRERVRVERDQLSASLTECGARPRPSQANFVIADFCNAEWAWRALAGLGIAVRRFAPDKGLDNSLRITCPGDDKSFDRLRRGLAAALRPQALLFSMDGVIADVSASYELAMMQTAALYGVHISAAEIAAAKSQGNASNDWLLTQRLLVQRGVVAPLHEITARFENLYQGCDGMAGLAAAECMIPDKSLLERLAKRMPLAIVTEHPQSDCKRFLNRFGLEHLFRIAVCSQDGSATPQPAPVLRALQLLGVDAAWMIGATPDDVVAARVAGAVPIGIRPPGDSFSDTAIALERAGAARILGSLTDLEAMLP